MVPVVQKENASTTRIKTILIVIFDNRISALLKDVAYVAYSSKFWTKIWGLPMNFATI